MQDERRQWLSALSDGEQEALQKGTALWRDEADARECWHLYHLIGDVLRSPELASTPARDAAFLAGLRTRLANEPVPLAPAPLPALPPSAPGAAQRQNFARRLGWRAPAAVAAGFAAVAATLVLMQPQGAAPGHAPQLAAGSASVAGGGVRVTSSTRPDAGGALIDDGRMTRDARLDAYLRAHQAARGNAPAALPGGGLRNAEILVTPLPGQSAAAAEGGTAGLRAASQSR